MIFCIVMPQVEAGAENKKYMYEACQLIQSELGLYFSSGTKLDIYVFWRTSYWSIEDKAYKKVERSPF